MTYPIFRRRSTALAAVMSWPSSSTRPDVGSIKRLIMRRIVDLPHPEGPISATSSPAETSSDSDPTATVPSSYVLPTPSRVIVAAFGAGGVRSTYVLPRVTCVGRAAGRCVEPVVLLALHPAER